MVHQPQGFLGTKGPHEIEYLGPHDIVYILAHLFGYDRRGGVFLSTRRSGLPNKP